MSYKETDAMTHKRPKGHYGDEVAKLNPGTKPSNPSEADEPKQAAGIPMELESIAMELHTLIDKIGVLKEKLTPVSRGEPERGFGAEGATSVGTSPVQENLRRIRDMIVIAHIRISSITEVLDI